MSIRGEKKQCGWSRKSLLFPVFFRCRFFYCSSVTVTSPSHPSRPSLSGNNKKPSLQYHVPTMRHHNPHNLHPTHGLSTKTPISQHPSPSVLQSPQWRARRSQRLGIRTWESSSVEHRRRIRSKNRIRVGRRAPLHGRRKGHRRGILIEDSSLHESAQLALDEKPKNHD